MILNSSGQNTVMEEPVSIEKHNLKVRRRNIFDTMNFAQAEDQNSNSEDRVPLVTMPDSTRAWHDNVIPHIPDIADFSLAGKQNGMLNCKDDSSLLESDFGDTDTLSHMERMKISVIRGSVVNPNLTLGEFRLLGCSSEGLVNGILLI